MNSNRPRPPKPINLLQCTQRKTADSRESKRTPRKINRRRKRKKNGRKDEIMTCVLQHRCPRRTAAPKRNAASAVPPGEKPSPADNAHIIVYCMLVYTTRTCSNDAHAARRQRNSPARAQRRGQCLPGGAATLLPKSSPPVRGEGVVVAKTRRAAALAQRRRPTSGNRAKQHETQTKTLSCKRVHPAQTSRNDDHAALVSRSSGPARAQPSTT